MKKINHTILPALIQPTVHAKRSHPTGGRGRCTSPAVGEGGGWPKVAKMAKHVQKNDQLAESSLKRMLGALTL